MTAPKKECGSCTACCRFMGIADMEPPKPKGVWCSHCNIGKGCGIYTARPQSCKDFECSYLAAFDTPKPPPLELRPDKSHVMMIPDASGENIVLYVDEHRRDAWRKPMITRIIKGLQEKGVDVCVVIGKVQYYVTKRLELLEMEKMSESPDGMVTQYRMPHPHLR